MTLQQQYCSLLATCIDFIFQLRDAFTCDACRLRLGPRPRSSVSDLILVTVAFIFQCFSRPNWPTSHSRIYACDWRFGMYSILWDNTKKYEENFNYKFVDILSSDHDTFTIGLYSIHLVTIGKIIEISSTEKFVFGLEFQVCVHLARDGKEVWN